MFDGLLEQGQGHLLTNIKAQIFVSFYLLPTLGNTCDVETVEQMIFP